MPPADAIDCVALLMIIFNTCVFCPILIYYLILYRHYETQQRDQSRNGTTIINERNSFLVYAINLLAIFTNCTERVFMVSSEVWGIIDVPFWTVIFFLAVMWWALMDLFAIKVYHLYYRQQLNQSIADRLWQKHIDPKEDDWYILNKHKYGNPLYLIKIAFIPYLISVIVDAGLFVFLLGGGIFLNLSHLTLASVPTSIAAYAFWKARKLNDIYSIRNEILYQFMIVLSTLSVWTIIFVVCQYVIGEDFENRHHDNVHRFEWMTYLFITDAVTFALALFSTLYPIYLTRQKESVMHLLSIQKCAHMGPSAACIHGIQGINSVIRDYDSFKSFMEHLVSEFCPENALFVVELIQIKHAYQVANGNVVRVPKQRMPRVRDQAQKNETDDTSFHVIDFNVYPEDADIASKQCIYSYIFHDAGTIRSQVILSAKVPSSAILSEAPHNLYLQMKRLCEKYVKVDSEYELNLPFEMRRALIHCFESEGMEEAEECVWFNVMDECCMEVLELLSNSFRRFINRDEYKQGAIPGSPSSLDDIAMKHILNSGELRVVRNMTSFSIIKRQYIQSMV